MKAKLFTVMTATALFFAACKHAPSEQTMKDIASFETSWTEMTSKAEVMTTDLQTSMDNCAKSCEKNAAMTMEGLKDEAKVEIETCIKKCADDKTAFDDLKKQWDAEGTSWMQVDSSFKALKDNALKGSITDEQAVKTLSELKAKLELGNKGLEDWNGKIATVKEGCTKNETAVASCCKKMEEAMAAEPKSKKKK